MYDLTALTLCFKLKVFTLIFAVLITKQNSKYYTYPKFTSIWCKFFTTYFIFCCNLKFYIKCKNLKFAKI